LGNGFSRARNVVSRGPFLSSFLCLPSCTPIPSRSFSDRGFRAFASLWGAPFRVSLPTGFQAGFRVDQADFPQPVPRGARFSWPAFFPGPRPRLARRRTPGGFTADRARCPRTCRNPRSCKTRISGSCCGIPGDA
jgi:hypothetical protein